MQGTYHSHTTKIIENTLSSRTGLANSQSRVDIVSNPRHPPDRQSVGTLTFENSHGERCHPSPSRKLFLQSCDWTSPLLQSLTKFCSTLHTSLQLLALLAASISVHGARRRGCSPKRGSHYPRLASFPGRCCCRVSLNGSCPHSPLDSLGKHTSLPAVTHISITN